MERTNGAVTGVILSDPRRSHQSLPLLAPRTSRNPGLPPHPTPGPVRGPGGPEAALTVGSELKLQKLMAEFALMTHIVTQIKVTLHGSQGGTRNQTFISKPYRRCLRPTLTFTWARGSDVKARPSALAKRPRSLPLPEVGASLAQAPAETKRFSPEGGVNAAPPPRPEAGSRLRLDPRVTPKLEAEATGPPLGLGCGSGALASRLPAEHPECCALSGSTSV